MSKNNVKKITDVEPLRPSQFQLAEHSYRAHNAVVPPGVKLDEILESRNYFAHVARQLQCGSEIRLQAADGEWVAYLYVSFVNGTDVRTHLVNFVSLEDAPNEAPSSREGYDVKLKGPLKWCLVKESDGTHIKEGIPTQKEAYKELDEYLAAMGR